MSTRTIRDWGARLVAFLFAGAAVAFGVSILASWIGLNATGVTLAVVLVLAILAYRIFWYQSVSEEPADAEDL